jgi:hypothetical protein
MKWKVMDWIHLALGWDSWWALMNSSNECACFAQCRELLDWLRKWWLLTIECTS